MTLFDAPSRALLRELARRFPRATRSQISRAALALRNGASPKRAAQILTETSS